MSCGCIPVSGGTRDEYPLVKATLHADIVDVQIQTVLTQTYVSNAARPAEIRYVFPLPAEASVCAFEAVIDGTRKIKGIVKGKEQARADYELAVSQGRTAALLEQTNVEIFEVNLGNIKPKQTIEVHITYVAIIVHDGGLDSLRLTFPTTIAPRYGFSPVQGPTASGAFLDMTVTLAMTGPIKAVSSPSHPIDVTMGQSTPGPSDAFDPRRARVALSLSQFLTDDVVIVVRAEGLDAPRCTAGNFTEEEGGTTAYALTLVPRFECPPLPSQEYIFLVDRSGSMDNKMSSLIGALQIMIASLPSRNTTFNIFSFGSSSSALHKDGSVPYTAATAAEAAKHVKRMRADFGGTEMVSALRAALTSRKGKATSVFVLTDGEAWALDDVAKVITENVDAAKKEDALLRVFCLGIGNAVSKAMCDIIARAGQGVVLYVREKEPPTEKLVALLRAARSAPVENISVDWGAPAEFAPEPATAKDEDFEPVSAPTSEAAPPSETAPVSLYTPTAEPSTVELGPQAPAPVKLSPPSVLQQAPDPTSLPSMYAGFRTSLFAIVRRPAKEATLDTKEIRITGTVVGQPVSLVVAVTPTPAHAKQEDGAGSPERMVHCLAARALIQRFEDAKPAMTPADEAEVLRLALKYGLASSQTSFVAIDETTGEKPKAVDAESAVDTVVDYYDPTIEDAQEEYSALRPSSQEKRKERVPSYSSYSASAQPVVWTSSLAPAGFGRGGGPPARLESMRRMSAVHGASAPGTMISQQSADVGSLSMLVDKSAPLSSSSGQFYRAKKKKGGAGIGLPVGAMLAAGASAVSSGMSVFSRRSRLSSSSPKDEGASQEDDAKPRAGVAAFAAHQAFDGSFTPSDALYKLVLGQSKPPALPASLAEKKGADAATLWLTLLCCAHLETAFDAEKGAWVLMVEKARDWAKFRVEELQLAPGAFDALEKEARTLVLAKAK